MQRQFKTMRYSTIKNAVYDTENGSTLVCESPNEKLATNVCRCLNNCDPADKAISKHIKKQESPATFYMCYVSDEKLDPTSELWDTYDEIYSRSHEDAAKSHVENQAEWLQSYRNIYVKVHEDGHEDEPKIIKVDLEKEMHANLA